uniref:Putative cwc25 spliceosome-associated protein n=1 Tax=Amblyomma aureolatum TaxID=187763 RepID=A0A1E1XCN0_9ACAR
MGGGDLNLKKSWHPSTLRNIERVWKAEQMRDQEKSKIEQLQKELQEERNKLEMRQYAENKGVVKKRQERLDWMYQGVAGLVDREQYLLGRKVDKNFEIAKKEEAGVEDKNEDLQPGAIFTMAPTNAAVDLENKIREDPLFAIKKQEMKSKKTLLSNPIKMKHLRDMIEQSIKKSKKAHKKKKKEHKKKRSSSVSSSSGTEHDQQERHSKVKPEKDQRDREHRASGHHSSETSRSKSSSSAHEHSRKARRRHDSSSSPDARSHHRVATQLKRPIKSSSETASKRKRHDSSTSNCSAKSGGNGESHHQPVGLASDGDDDHRDRRPKFGLLIRGDQSWKKERQPAAPLKAQWKKPEPAKEEITHRHRRRPLSEEEKAAARKEMMENAHWRDEQRKTFVHQYRSSEASEEEKHHKRTGEGFIRPMLAKAADSGSVENRIKQKMYTVQRSSGAMDSHFARKK